MWILRERGLPIDKYNFSILISTNYTYFTIKPRALFPMIYENQSYLNFMDFNKKLFYLCTIFSIECGKL